MTSIKHILAPTDYSDLALHALRHARDLARNYLATLHVLHVVAPMTEMASASSVPELTFPTVQPEPADQELERESNRLRVHVADVVGRLPIEPVAVLRVGVAWREIVQYAADTQIELIVIGTHARGLLQRMLLGSTSKAVLEHVTCPVLMVPVVAVMHAQQAADSAARMDEMMIHK